MALVNSKSITPCLLCLLICPVSNVTVIYWLFIYNFTDFIIHSLIRISDILKDPECHEFYLGTSEVLAHSHSDRLMKPAQKSFSLL